MWATVQRFLTPRWILAHVLIWAGAATMVGLGHWQLDVSNAKHFDLQNFGYSLQWWAFGAFTLFMWVRAIRDTLRRVPPAVPTGGEVVRRGDAGGPATTGPAELTTAGTGGAAPVVYRGYAMPQSSQIPARSDGDELHGAYNDYLWQLALADGAVPGAAGSPQVVAGEHVEERDGREEQEDRPGRLLGAGQVRPTGEVDPAEHDGQRMDEAHE